MARCAMMSLNADLGALPPGTDPSFADTDEKLSRVQHELRTPLTSIRAIAEILLDNPELSKAEQRAFLAIIVDESERLGDAASWVAALIEADARHSQTRGPTGST
jgi:signal transduction histidine kinase